MTNLRDVISQCGGVIGNHTFLVDKFLMASDPIDTDIPTENKTTTAKTETEEAYMATEFLSGISLSKVAEKYRVYYYIINS